MDNTQNPIVTPASPQEENPAGATESKPSAAALAENPPEVAALARLPEESVSLLIINVYCRLYDVIPRVCSAAQCPALVPASQQQVDPADATGAEEPIAPKANPPEVAALAAPPEVSLSSLIASRYRKINDQELAEVMAEFPDETILRQKVKRFCGVDRGMPLGFFIQALSRPD